MPSGSDYFSYLEGNIQLATGAYNGDGNQASHWKDGLGLGILDPTLAPGELSTITYNDLVAMDLIGWEIVPEPTTILTLALGTLLMRKRKK
ncbi:MAG: PEP-CTERM sorting domain-containing protein [Planctomycetes bacterium]|nr:PEP-CTERM sorting domain-containing protein [Planctomycetota bacterium]